MATVMSSLKKVVWSIDVLGDEKRIYKPMMNLLREVVGPTTQVEPVYVMSPDFLRLAAEVLPENGQDFKEQIQTKLAQWQRGVEWNQVLSPTLLIAEQVTLRSSVNTLIHYAKSTGADLIACTTSAKKGLRRFVLGSFAELLMTHSSVPVLMTNPQTRVPAAYKRILFAFDFSKEAEPVLIEAAKFARTLEAELILFHQLESAASVYPPEFRAVWPAIMEEDKATIAARRATGERWVQELASFGVRSRFVLGTKATAPSDAILAHAAKLRVNMIALASRRGTVAASMTGSVSRQVCRGASVPVWVLHPQKGGMIRLSK